MDKVIEFKNVSFEYTDRKILSNISFTIDKGSFVGIIGGNGSGKSTLMKLMNGILLPSSGEVLVDGMDTRDEKLIMDIRRRIGMVFQNPENQIIASTVEEDVVFGMENIGIAPEEMEEKLQQVLKFVGLGGKRLKNPYTLSGGQKQRLAIASVMAMDPAHLIMDEPTSMLDPEGASEVTELFSKLRETGKTLVVSTHEMRELIHCDRIIYMENSTVKLDSEPSSVFSKLKNSQFIEIPECVRTKFKIR